MKQFEYIYKDYSRKNINMIINDLNKLGIDGWELISNINLTNTIAPNNTICLFKREIYKVKVS